MSLRAQSSQRQVLRSEKVYIIYNTCVLAVPSLYVVPSKSHVTVTATPQEAINELINKQ